MSLSGKWRRLKEALHLIRHNGAGLRSKWTILRCFASILRSTTNREPVEFTLATGGLQRPFAMRKSDIFTLGEIFFEGQYRPLEPLRPGARIIDAGANVGVSALWFLGLQPEARLWAFEPEPENFGFLEKNLRGIGGARAIRAALGRHRGEIDLHLADHGAVHSVVDRSVGERRVTVPQLALAEFLDEEGIDRVDLLKLDVEGSEAEVIAGLGDRIDRVQAIIGEFHEKLVDGRSFYSGLESRGFELVSREHFGGADSGVHTFQMIRRRG